MTCRMLAMAAFVALVEHAALPGAIAAPGGSGTSKSTSADSMITVVKAGSGTGSVVAGAGVIDCGATCSGLYTDGTILTLTATPSGGSQFTGWLGPCTGSSTCSFVVGGATTVQATFAAPPLAGALYDIDGNASCDALTDGLMALRYLFGLTGPALISNAVADGAPRSTEPQVIGYLTDVRPRLDIDGNGQADALSDGLLLIRYQFGLRGASLVSNAVGPGALRTAAEDIEGWLSGCGGEQAQVAAVTPAVGFGNVPVGTTSGTLVAQFTNSGSAATGALGTVLSGDADFAIALNTCAGTLAPSATCAVTLDFTPSGVGSSIGQLTVSGLPGGSASVPLSGTGVFQLTVVVNGGGSVGSADGQISGCTGAGGDCVAEYASATTATLTAITQNGSNAYFRDWDSTSCNGPARACNEPINAHKTVTAHFGSYASSGNLMFASSTTNDGFLGSFAEIHDDTCNDLASAAGINNLNAPAGSLYMAWVSTQTSNARTRLGANVRGWVRLDGAVLADDQASLFNPSSPKFMNAVRYDENGNTVTTNNIFLTGTNTDGTTGTFSQNCTNWTTTVGTFLGGDSREGSLGWTAAATFSCAATGRLLCVMKKNNVAVAPPAPPPGAKRIVVSNTTFTPNAVLTPTQKCVAEAGANYVALIGSIGNQTSALINPATTYVRPDGVVIGTGAQLIAASQTVPSPSGIFQRANGNYIDSTGNPGVTYMGPPGLGVTGTVTNTCNNWTDPTGIAPTYTPYVGNPTQTTSWWFSNGYSSRCDTPRPIYCIEQ